MAQGSDHRAPVPYAGLREKYLAECQFRGRENRKIQFAILAGAAARGGIEPDLLGEVAMWQTDDFWWYALAAAVAVIRACADRMRLPVPAFVQRLSGEGAGAPRLIATAVAVTTFITGARGPRSGRAAFGAGGHVAFHVPPCVSFGRYRREWDANHQGSRISAAAASSAISHPLARSPGASLTCCQSRDTTITGGQCGL
jgi:hypothetical protein